MSLKPGHDGSVAFASDGRLEFSLEAEKDSFPRYGNATAQLLADALELAPAFPDVLALGGWHKILPRHDSNIGAGYFGVDSVQTRDGHLFGRPVTMFSSSHERSHVFMPAAMYPEALALGDLSRPAVSSELHLGVRGGGGGRAHGQPADM